MGIQIQGWSWYEAVAVVVCAVCALVRGWLAYRATRRREREQARRVCLMLVPKHAQTGRTVVGVPVATGSGPVGRRDDDAEVDAAAPIPACVSLVEFGQFCTQLAGARVGEVLVVDDGA